VSARRLAAVAALVGWLTTCTVAAAPGPMSGAAMRRAMQATTESSRTVVALHEQAVHIEIRNFAFHPARLVVSPGTRVIWVNEDEEPHTVRTYGAGFASPAIVTNGHFATVLRRTGTYAYYCTIHPFMHGAVVVRG
jgi:plastocyanin